MHTEILALQAPTGHDNQNRTKRNRVRDREFVNVFLL